MYLFFDAVSSQGYLGLFDEQRIEQASMSFSVAGSEGKDLPGMIDIFLQKEDISYTQIQNIVCVVGPGSFTGIRMISLVVNTIAYIYPHISLTALSFFDLYENYPIVKISSKRDLFVKWNKRAIIEVVTNETFLETMGEKTKYYGDCLANTSDTLLSCISVYSPKDVFSQVVLTQHKKIAPLYVKKPNIS